MCKLLAELLQTDKASLKHRITRLEHASGLPGIDLKLTGEIYGSAAMKLRGLGLDPRDTTAPELYSALNGLAALHDNFLARHFGVDSLAPTNELLPRLVYIIERMNIPKQAWLMKPTAAKRLLKKNPPKQLQKLLHYRSLDSLLKREPTSAVLNLARFTESEQWYKKLLDGYRTLTPLDFEVRDIEVVSLDHGRWQRVAERHLAHTHTNIATSLELGVVHVLPLPVEGRSGLTLLTTSLVLHALQDIRSHSTLFKFHQVQPNFGQLLVDTLTGELKHHAEIAGQPIHWRVVHRHYGSSSRLEHPEIFDPHIQHEDLDYHKTEAVLYRFEPALHFWHDLDYVGVACSDGPLSFNLMDVVINLVNQLPYEKRVSYHLKSSLLDELHRRYIAERQIERELLQQLDQGVVADMEIFADMEFAV